MYLSRSNSTLLENGNFMIFTDLNKLRSEKDSYFSYEISPFEEGLKIEMNQNGKITFPNHTGNICLIGASLRINSKLPIHNFLNRFPRKIINKMWGFIYAQTTMLQLCAQYKSACDLIDCNKNLLWLLSVDYFHNSLKYPIQTMGHLLSQKQRDIFHFIFPETKPSNQYIKFISKVLLHQGNDYEHSILERAINKLSLLTIKKFNHWQKIPISILDLITDHPELISYPLIMQISINYYTFFNEGADELLKTFCDTWFLAKALKIKHSESIIKKVKTKEQLNKLHDRWVEKNLAKKDLEMLRAHLPNPPISGNRNIIPLITEKDLFLEGQELHHCVHCYKGSIDEGACYIYKMLKPERCTIELLITGNFLKIGQVRTYGNQDVSEQTMKTVYKWFNEEYSNSKLFRKGSGKSPPSLSKY